MNGLNKKRFYTLNYKTQNGLIMQYMMYLLYDVREKIQYSEVRIFFVYTYIIVMKRGSKLWMVSDVSIDFL